MAFTKRQRTDTIVVHHKSLICYGVMPLDVGASQRLLLSDSLE